jgi:hypothetical protein
MIGGLLKNLENLFGLVFMEQSPKSNTDSCSAICKGKQGFRLVSGKVTQGSCRVRNIMTSKSLQKVEILLTQKF